MARITKRNRLRVAYRARRRHRRCRWPWPIAEPGLAPSRPRRPFADGARFDPNVSDAPMSRTARQKNPVRRMLVMLGSRPAPTVVKWPILIGGARGILESQKELELACNPTERLLLRQRRS